MSKIGDYKLEQVVRDLRAEGKSIQKIANTLNQLIPQDEEPISAMAVSRWLRAEQEKGGSLPMINVNNPVTLNQNNVDAAEDVNPYDETLKLIEDCDLQIDKLKYRIEASPLLPAKAPNGADPASLLAQYIARKQSLLADIAGYQKDIASYGEVKEMLRLVTDTLKEVSPEAYELFKKKITEKHTLKSIIK